MNKQDCYYLGTIVSKFSFKGELLLKLDSDEIDYKKIRTIFIETEGSLVPFEIKKVLLHKSSLLRLKVENIDNEEKAIKILRSEVYLPLKDLPKLNGNKFYFHEIINFKVVDNNLGDIGTVINVNDQTSQPVLIVSKNNKEIMIPLVDEFLSEIKRKEKKIIFNLPEGLTDI
ncbi:MAG: 16S rRNA processing protein RimM [Flavobacteriales bacterium]|nr:MAG: 16S rRNA processing protein RimM [Flavobacteriales bacterium]|tara:strand:+ start:32 stop:547 length:516 start_codon:yes stop_codon:yes gene_type:complete